MAIFRDGIQPIESMSDAVIFVENQDLLLSLAKQLEQDWQIEGYVDAEQIEHIRLFREPACSEAELWEKISYASGEQPLELMFIEDYNTGKGVNHE